VTQQELLNAHSAITNGNRNSYDVGFEIVLKAAQNRRRILESAEDQMGRGVERIARIQEYLEVWLNDWGL
jgi:hypothetical protein